MSELLSSITGILRWLFRNLLSSWGDLAPVSSKTTKPFELLVPEEGLEEEKEGNSNYETTLTYQNIQNTKIRWYLAIWRFLFWKKQGLNIEFYNRSIQ